MDVVKDEDLAKRIIGISERVTSLMKSKAPLVHTAQFGLQQTCMKIFSIYIMRSKGIFGATGT